MKLSEYVFSDLEIKNLKLYRDKQKNPALKIRFIVLLMIAFGSDIMTVSSAAGISRYTIENWFNKYLTEGIDSINTFNYKPKQPYLNINQINQVVIWVIFENPGNTKQVREYIHEKFGISYTCEAVRQLLKKRGLAVIRPGTHPGSPPGVEEQKQFICEYFKMKSSGPPGSVTLFGDAMHLAHNNVPGLCWGDPKFVPVMDTNSGRRRLNILGAYNPDSHSFLHLTGEENCNAERVTEYLELIMKSFPCSPEINLIVDNARYFHARIVSEWLEENKKINLIFLPGYAPNLNLIERFWRFAKNKLVRNKYYKEYKKFRAKAFQFLNNVNDYADEFKTLMVEKFQIVYA